MMQNRKPSNAGAFRAIIHTDGTVEVSHKREGRFTLESESELHRFMENRDEMLIVRRIV